MAFPGMIAIHAEGSGMKIPKDPDEDFDPDEYPHFHVFCNIQLGAPIVNISDVAENARIIAKIPESKIRKVTLAYLIARGAHVHT